MSAADAEDRTLGQLADEAAQRYVAQGTGGMVTGMLAAVTFIDSEGEERYAIATGPGQTWTTTLGLLRTTDLNLTHQFKEHL